MISSQEAYLLRPISLLRWACDSLSPLKSSKTNRRFQRTQFAQEIRKDPKMKKKTISVTVTYLLISKTGSSESRSELSSMAELTRVRAECQRYMKSLFNTRLLCGESGRFTRRVRNKRSNARRFFSRSSPFFWFILSCFLQFLTLFFFSKNKKLPQELYIRVFSPMMDIKLLFIIGI